MRSTRARSLAVATVAAGLLAGGITAGTTGAFTSDKPTDTIAEAAAARPQNQPKTQGEDAVNAATGAGQAPTAPRAAAAEGCKTDTSQYEIRNHWVNIKTANLKVRITRCVDSSGKLTPSTTTRIFATTTTAGDWLYGATVTPEPVPAIIKATDRQYILEQDIDSKTCLAVKNGPFCYHNNITFTITVNKTGTKWEIRTKDTSLDDDIVPA
ncbi:hypothetical protein ACFYYH_33170 [Streptomyces sp. NPDC002018]|uniref:hypothetical protein n=1 Tax=Streptomyces sp. NPDC002018 TaxID=3364629 RepID=UPI00367B04FD